MRDVIIRWVLPATRESGLPLDPADIQHTLVELSADGGANFTLVDSVLGSALAQETLVQDLDNGNWIARLTVVDTAGREGAAVDTPFVSDVSAPGTVTNVEVILQ